MNCRLKAPFEDLELSSIVDNWDVVKDDLKLDLKAQYTTAFGYFVPGADATLITPTTLLREPALLREKWDEIFGSALPKNPAQVGAKAKEVALAFYKLLKDSLRKGDKRRISFATPISCEVSGRGVTKSSGRSASTLMSVNSPPLSSIVGFLIARLHGRKGVRTCLVC